MNSNQKVKNEDIIKFLEGIITECEHMHPGNVSHNSKGIIGNCRNIIDTLKLEDVKNGLGRIQTK